MIGQVAANPLQRSIRVAEQSGELKVVVHLADRAAPASAAKRKIQERVV